jgi:exodeoxyribonuclease-3
MKIATWNVNGIRARAPQLAEFIAVEAPDVLCLQEIKATPAQVPPDPRVAELYHAHFHGHGGYSGVALLLKRDVFPSAKFTHPPFDLESRIVVAEQGDLVFGSVYVPNGGKDFMAKMAFLADLDAWAADLEASGRKLVLCGDFNVARTPIDVHPVLRKNMIGQLSDERALIESLLSRGLVDVGRMVAPDDDRLFTWWAPWRNLRQRNIGWRLDYVAAHRSLVGEGTTCVSQRDVGTSDHGPVVAVLAK